METITKCYTDVNSTPSDINEHIATLYRYATECERITECAARPAISTWAFLKGLIDGGHENKEFTLVYTSYYPNIEVAKHAAIQCGLNAKFIKGNDLMVELERTDLLFIDSWHVYGHMKRELEKLAPLTQKYIIMHDTTIDAYYGESIRVGWNIKQQSIDSGIPVDEIAKGIWPAIEEFLAVNADQWTLHERYVNNNGLTILKRIKTSINEDQLGSV